MDITPRIIAFVSHSPANCKKQTGNADYYCFSNWSQNSFVCDGIKYISSEQWMMACKARLFNDAATEAKILAVDFTTGSEKDWFNTQAKIKQLGREVAGFSPEIWNRDCFELVKKGVLMKFQQNPKIAETLKSTGNAILCEASAKDNVWGIGLAITIDGKPNPAIQNMDAWPGTNLLGKCLMAARAELIEFA